MAEAILMEVATMLFSKLASLVADPILTAWGLNIQLKKLQKTMETINAILADHSKRGSNISRVDEKWILDLDEVIYELDDIFDEILAKAERKKIMEGNVFLKEVKLFFSSSNQLYTCFELSQRVKSIRESLDDISKDRRDFGSGSINPSIVHGVEESNKHNDVVFVPDNVVGRKDDKEHIIKMVLGDMTSSDDEGSVGVIPIVGVGGLGKTTLARQVYSDERVKESFQLHLCVPIPREIKVKEVMERIVSVATGEDVSKYDIEQLRSRFSTLVNGKKYLLILDDVWDENPLKWRDLRPMLTRGAASGSKIIVTTRSVTVGEIMGTDQSYQLRPLSNDDSRTLFENIVFQNKGRHESGTRVLVGDILGMSRNVPLVIRALAGVLATMFTVKEWLSFKQVELSNLASYGEGFDVVPILRLSYDNLRPSNLKSCFSYLSLFHRGDVISKRSLIYLWNAQGFIGQIHKGQILEDVGETYLNTLIKKSLIQDVEKDDEDGSCKLHDLMYDLACSVNGGQCRMLKSAEDGDFERNMHHVSVGYRLDTSCTTPVALQSNRRLRTFLLAEKPSYRVHMSKQVCDKLISSFPCLRGLDLHGLGITELPNSIGKLIHLRYMNLSYNDFKELPDSITLLHNLQYLELFHCCKLSGIPRDMKKLVNLRHLGLSSWESWGGTIRYFPSGFENLTNLGRLEVFLVPDLQAERVKSVCRGSSHSIGYARLGDLNSLNNLRGSLSILFVGSYQNMALDAKKANLKEKKGVKDLVFCWVRGYEEEDHLTFENLQSHREISSLTIRNYSGDALPTWMATSQLASSLLYMTHLTIHSCSRIKYIPSLSKLPNLKSFLFYALPEVEYLENDIDRYDQLSSSYSSSSSSSSSSHSPTIFFPSLTNVYIGHLPSLKGWGEYALSFPNATHVTIFHCYVLESLPVCPNVEHLVACFVPEHLQMLTVKSQNGASPATTTPKLQTLEVSTVKQLTSIPGDYLATVSKLTFGWGEKPLNFSLFAQVLDLMNSLRHLSFFECQSLRSFSGLPMQLGTLERLEFSGCNSTREFSENVDHDSESSDDYSCSFDSNSWNVFKSLRFLKFENMESMNILPEGIQCITTLETLELHNCPSLEAIPNWIGCLSSSLLRLSIHKCQQLTSLPSEIQRLQKLQQLVVDDCPPLADQCQKDIGKDWHKIQHIPDIIITR